jgi:hypothetical protein
MKNILTSIALLLILVPQFSLAQEDKGFKLGLQFGNSSSNLKLTGGMENANGRFKQRNFGVPSINLVARYDFNKHWMIESGIGLNGIGFSFSISENYPLFNSKYKSSDIKTLFTAFEVPVMLFYKFNPNCKNSRWIVGAGFAPTLYEGKSDSQDFSLSSEGQSTNYLSSQSVSNGNGSLLLRYSVGREKVFKNGSLLQASLLMNIGFGTVATSTVNYTIENEKYSHSFANNGSSVAFRIAYLFKTNRSASLPVAQ